MNIIVVADVFGNTEALEQLVARLHRPALVVEPYSGKKMNFSSEADAYHYFTHHVGLPAYTNILEKVLCEQQNSVMLIGFSMGASAIWNISVHKQLGHVNRAVCFYSSQIRHNTNLVPVFPIHLIFPASEQHFSVSDVIKKLSNKQNISITQVNYLHGFMNACSVNFNEAAYKETLKRLVLDLS